MSTFYFFFSDEEVLYKCVEFYVTSFSSCNSKYTYEFYYVSSACVLCYLLKCDLTERSTNPFAHCLIYPAAKGISYFCITLHCFLVFSMLLYCVVRLDVYYSFYDSNHTSTLIYTNDSVAEPIGHRNTSLKRHLQCFPS